MNNYLPIQDDFISYLYDIKVPLLTNYFHISIL